MQAGSKGASLKCLNKNRVISHPWMVCNVPYLNRISNSDLMADGSLKGAAGWQLHQFSGLAKLCCYISTKIEVQPTKWGTLAFHNLKRPSLALPQTLEALKWKRSLTMWRNRWETFESFVLLHKYIENWNKKPHIHRKCLKCLGLDRLLLNCCVAEVKATGIL